MKKKKLILKEIIKETVDTNTLVFSQQEGEGKFIFEAGQYLNLFIDGVSKMYTISSAPHEKDICISIKKQRNFSVKLHDLKIGDEIQYLGPFGFLTLTDIDDEKRKNDLVFISAGIGITPFFSILKSEKESGFKNKISLFYSNKNQENTIFHNQFEKISNETDAFEINHYWSELENRMSIEKIKNRLDDLKNKTYLICGPIKFVEEFWKELKDRGVEEDDIHTESFFAQ